MKGYSNITHLNDFDDYMTEAAPDTPAQMFYIAYPTDKRGLDGKSDVLQHVNWDV